MIRAQNIIASCPICGAEFPALTTLAGGYGIIHCISRNRELAYTYDLNSSDCIDAFQRILESAVAAQGASLDVDSQTARRLFVKLALSRESDGRSLTEELAPTCPDCGSQEKQYWTPRSPESYKPIQSIEANTTEWRQLSEERKKALMLSEISGVSNLSDSSDS